MLYVDPWVYVVSVIVIVIVIVLVVYWGVRAHRKRIAAGKEDLVGRAAVVEIALDPKGVVLVEGERWTAQTDGDRIEPEEEVLITKVEGLKLKVTRKV